MSSITVSGGVVSSAGDATNLRISLSADAKLKPSEMR